jgi:hypothetical protein
MRLRRVAVSTFFLGLGVYIWLPTADEIAIHPTFGWFLAYVLNIPLVYGVLLSMLIYRGVGTASLLGALILGGKPVYTKLKERFSRKTKNSEAQPQEPKT